MFEKEVTCLTPQRMSTQPTKHNWSKPVVVRVEYKRSGLSGELHSQLNCDLLSLTAKKTSPGTTDMKMAISYLLVVLALAMPIVLCHSQRMDDGYPEDGPITYQSGESLYSNSCHIHMVNLLMCVQLVLVCVLQKIRMIWTWSAKRRRTKTIMA